MFLNSLNRWSAGLVLLAVAAVTVTATRTRAEQRQPQRDPRRFIGPADPAMPAAAPGELVVRIAPGVDIRTIAAQLGGSVKRRLRYAPNTYVIAGLGEEGTARAGRALSAIPGVLAATPNQYLRPAGVPLVNPNDPLFGEQWALRAIAATDAYGITVGERLVNGPLKNVVVGLLDFGPLLSHPDLAENFEGGAFDFIDDVPYVDDSISALEAHGTAMASGIAAVTNNAEGLSGTNWEGVTVLPCHVGEFVVVNGSVFSTISVSAAIDAIYYCMEEGVDIISMSFGSSALAPPNLLLALACNDAYNQGIVLVAASGNGRFLGTSFGVNYPAAFPEVIAVGATGPNNELASYSDGGPQLELMAPGGNDSTFSDVSRQVLVADSSLFSTPFPGIPRGYTGSQGTSIATAICAGTIATLITQGARDETLAPAAQVEALRLLMRSTARSPAGGRNNDFGFGLINLDAALRRVTQYVEVLSPEPGETTESFGEVMDAFIVHPVPSVLQPGDFRVFKNGVEVTNEVQITDPVGGGIRFQPDVNSIYRVGINRLNIIAKSKVLPAADRSLEGPALGRIPARSLRFRVEPHVEQKGLGAFSVPYVLRPGADTLQFLTGGNLVRLARWLPDQNRYAIFDILGSPQDPAASLTTRAAGVATPPVGVGFWARKISQTQVQLLGSAVRAPTYEIPLRPGFNLIGNPYPFQVPFVAVDVRFGDEVLSITDAARRGLIRNVLWRYNGRRYEMSVLPQGDLVPWEAQWVQAFAPVTLVVPRLSNALTATAAPRSAGAPRIAATSVPGVRVQSPQARPGSARGGTTNAALPRDTSGGRVDATGA